MGDDKKTGLIDPAKNLPLDEWFDLVEDIALDRGEFEPLGPDHTAILLRDGPQLLVTFETLDTVRGRVTSDVPIGWGMAANNGWSQLCILSHMDTWYRHRAIYQYFDKLVDEDFFEQYDRVVFYGNGPCGYAAAAYSVTAPGATVVALSPQATLDPRMTEWDNRFTQMRRVSFTDRYGYAPEMLDAAEHAFVLYDRDIDEDAMHAALYRRPNVSRIRTRALNGQIEMFLRRMDLLEPLLKAAMDQTLTLQKIHTALRERRNYLPYLRRFLATVEERKRPFLTALMCRSVLERINTPRFRRQLTIAQTALNKEGRRLPPARNKEKA